MCMCCYIDCHSLHPWTILPASCISRKYILVLSNNQEDGHPELLRRFAKHNILLCCWNPSIHPQGVEDVGAHRHREAEGARTDHVLRRRAAVWGRAPRPRRLNDQRQNCESCVRFNRTVSLIQMKCTSGTVALFQTLADRFYFCTMVWNIWFYLVLAMQRVMPTSFFLLLRFFLRVDGVLIRINDTRLYHEASCFSPLCSSVGLLSSVLKEAGLSVQAAASTSHFYMIAVFFCFQAGNSYMLREFSTRESKIEELKVSIWHLVQQ